MKKHYQILVGLVLFLLGFLSLQFYIQKDRPKFFEEEIEKYRKNFGLMVSIGGFKSFTYRYNKNQLKEDTLNFRIVILGKKKDFVVIGEAIKNTDNNWIILEEKTTKRIEE